MRGNMRRFPSGPEIVELRFDALDIEPDRAAAREVQHDRARGCIRWLETDRQERQNALRRVLPDSHRLGGEHPRKLETAATPLFGPETPSMKRIPREAIGEHHEFLLGSKMAEV